MERQQFFHTYGQIPKRNIQDAKLEINKTLLVILNMGNPSNQKQFRLKKKIYCNSDS